MRLFSSLSPFAAVLALGLAAPLAIGCAAPTAGDTESAVGTGRQAIFGEILEGVEASMEVVKMIKTYQMTGQYEVNNAEILEKVVEVQHQLSELKASVDQIQNAIDTTDRDVLAVPAMHITDAVDALWRGYVSAAGSTEPNAMANFLAEVRSGTATQGSLTVAQLEDLGKLIAGTVGSSSLLSAIATSEAKKGEAAIKDDTIGRFMAEMRLVQEQGFFLLAVANATNPSFDLKVEIAAHQARMNRQDIAFFETTATYNETMLAQAASARTAQVSGCIYTDAYADFLFTKVELYPNDGYYAFDDAAWDAGDGLVRAHDFEIEGKSACYSARDAWVTKVVAEKRAALTTELETAEATQKAWNTL